MDIIHGNYLSASRNFLNSKIKASLVKEVIRLEGKKVSLTDLKQALESQSFFGTEKLVVLENIFSSPKSNRKNETLDYLKKADGNTDIIIWESKKIDGRILKSFTPKFKIRLFEIPFFIFKLLDSLSPFNKKNSLELLHQCLKTEPPELIFYLISRRVRDLIVAADLGKNGLSRFQVWQQQKLIAQAEKYNIAQLLKWHKILLILDYQQKTGQSSFSLGSSLDLLLASLQ